MNNLPFNYKEVLSTTVGFVPLEEVFTPTQCDTIINIFRARGLEDGRLSKGDKEHGIRESKIKFSGYDPEIAWVFERIREVVKYANEHFFDYILYGFDRIQYAEYIAPSGHYEWHNDVQMFGRETNGEILATRKISISIFLTDPIEYEGGQLLIDRGSNNEPGYAAIQTKGSALLFPSYAPHCVTPVTKGNRSSLVIWVEGPKLR